MMKSKENLGSVKTKKKQNKKKRKYRVSDWGNI